MSISEHLRPGEDVLAGAIRGLKEELGIEGVNVQPVSGVMCDRLEVAEQGIRDYEFQMCSWGVSDADLKPKSSEVAETRFVDLGDLNTAMQYFPGIFTRWFRERAHDIGLID